MQVFKTAFRPSGISKNQIKRYLLAQLVSSIVILIAVFAVVSNLLELDLRSLVYLTSIWVLVNVVAVRLLAKRILHPSETKVKGSIFGAVAACMSFLAAFSIFLFTAMLGDFTEQDVANSANFGEAALNALLSALFLFVYGGFLVVPAGGFIGWLLTRNDVR